MEAANHIAMYVPMQQSCIICNVPQKLKYKIGDIQNIYFEDRDVFIFKIFPFRLGTVAHTCNPSTLGG